MRGDHTLSTTARAHLADALANEARNLTILDVRAFAFRAGLVVGPRRGTRRPDIPAVVRGRATALLLALKDEPEPVPGWRVELDQTGSRPRLICRRAPAAA